MTIAQIKERLSIGEVLSHYGLQANRNKMLSCPFHDDKTPSMQVYPNSNTVYCFSSNCKIGGKAIDQIDFILHKEGISKHQAILQAKKLAGHQSKPSMKSTTPSASPNLDHLFTQLKKRFHRGSRAKQYANRRSILDPTIPIGWNTYKTDYPHLRNCIIFPLKNKAGQIVSLYGRSITGSGDNAHYYLKNRKGLYPGYPATHTQTLIITEAIIDAATLQTHTDHPVLSLYGTNGWNEEHTTAIKALKDLQELIFFLDGDLAGQQAIQTYAPLVKAMCPGIRISQVQTPDGEDVNSLAQNHPGQESQILTHLIDQRTFLFSSESSSDVQGDSSGEKKKDPTTHNPLDQSDPDYPTWSHGPLHITVLGGVMMHPVDKMIVTLELKRKDSSHPRHKLRQRTDLFDDDKTQRLAQKIAERMELSGSEVMDALTILTDLLDAHRRAYNLQRQQIKKETRTLSPPERNTAREFLSQPALIKRTNECIGKTGVVGEMVNRMILWLVFTSRLREKPLHVICLGASGTGKTYLQESIARLMPEDHKYQITAMSDNSVYYFEEDELVQKLVLIEDLDGANEEKVLLALRELMTKEWVIKAIVIKDNKGKMKTIRLKVRGPICLAGTTTRERLYEDNANRSLLLYLDQSKEQKQKIMDYQRKVSANKIDRHGQQDMIRFLQNIQLTLQPIHIVNPFAEMLHIPAEVFKPLRTNQHYLLFIETVTFYHQYQREKKYDPRGNPYIETTLEDIQIANQLIKDVLLAKSDELTKVTRRFYQTLQTYLQQQNKPSFYASEIRKAYRMSPATVSRHLYTLMRYGYVKTVGGSRARGYEYEIITETIDLRTCIDNALDQALQKIKEHLKDHSGKDGKAA